MEETNEPVPLTVGHQLDTIMDRNLFLSCLLMEGGQAAEFDKLSLLHCSQKSMTLSYSFLMHGKMKTEVDHPIVQIFRGKHRATRQWRLALVWRTEVGFLLWIMGYLIILGRFEKYKNRCIMLISWFSGIHPMSMVGQRDYPNWGNSIITVQEFGQYDRWILLMMPIWKEQERGIQLRLIPAQIMPSWGSRGNFFLPKQIFL